MFFWRQVNSLISTALRKYGAFLSDSVISWNHNQQPGMRSCHIKTLIAELTIISMRASLKWRASSSVTWLSPFLDVITCTSMSSKKIYTELLRFFSKTKYQLRNIFITFGMKGRNGSGTILVF